MATVYLYTLYACGCSRVGLGERTSKDKCGKCKAKDLVLGSFVRGLMRDGRLSPDAPDKIECFIEKQKGE